MGIPFKVGLDVIKSYRRLAYTPWHALAEFVDNSTQSYFNNRQVLDNLYEEDDEMLEVRIVYDRDQELLRITDNAMGMSYKELEAALHLAKPPENTNGRSKYGMGLKTSACWIGNKWSIKTKKLGESIEHKIEVDVEKLIANGVNDLPYSKVEGKDEKLHYTIVEIKDHNQEFRGRTLTKIKDFLKSMYREDFRNGLLHLEFNGEVLEWDEHELHKDKKDNEYRREFEFKVDEKKVWGWVGVLASGSRANAGFSIIYHGRVIRGYPDAWRPSSLYGQFQGSNDLINQRLIGEIHLDEFEVSHTKDGILWMGNQEEEVEQYLLEKCVDYKEFAKEYRKGTDIDVGPSDLETDSAISDLEKELSSSELIDKVKFDSFNFEEELLDKQVVEITNEVSGKDQPKIKANVGDILVYLYISSDISTNDPYLIVDSSRTDEVYVTVNKNHPHWKELKGSEGLKNYLKHCIYDGISEWQAKQKVGSIKPTTIKKIKDSLLRVRFTMEHEVN